MGKIGARHTKLPVINGNKLQKDMTATPSKYPQGYFKEKGCRLCSKVFKPNAPSHLYCSQVCADRSIADKAISRKYEIGLIEYERMLNEQDGKCAICKGEGFTMAKYHHKKLVIDHCHKTGKVRGLLCHNCNRGLGLLKEDAEVIKEAARYVERN